MINELDFCKSNVLDGVMYSRQCLPAAPSTSPQRTNRGAQLSSSHARLDNDVNTCTRSVPGFPKQQSCCGAAPLSFPPARTAALKQLGSAASANQLGAAKLGTGHFPPENDHAEPQREGKVGNSNVAVSRRRLALTVHVTVTVTSTSEQASE